MKTRNPNHYSTRNSGWNRATLALVPLENKTFQGYRAVKTGTKLMMRGTAQSSLHGRTCREAVYLFKTEARQKHTPREECRHLPNEHIREVIKSCMWSSSSGSLFSSGQLSLLFSNIQPGLGPFLIFVHTFCQDGFQHGAYERLTAPIMGWCPLSF